MKCVIFKLDGSARQFKTHMRSAIKCAEWLANGDETVVLTFTNTGKFSDKAVWSDEAFKWVREEALA